ncbi:MAG: hypothetical protein WDW36_002653 [Sanguina aurantia]
MVATLNNCPAANPLSQSVAVAAVYGDLHFEVAAAGDTSNQQEPWLASFEKLLVLSSPESASAEASESARQQLDSQLHVIEEHLASSGGAHLVGESVTVADIGMACALQPVLLRTQLSPSALAAFPRTHSWLTATTSQPQFAGVLGAAHRRVSTDSAAAAPAAAAPAAPVAVAGDAAAAADAAAAPAKAKVNKGKKGPDNSVDAQKLEEEKKAAKAAAAEAKLAKFNAKQAASKQPAAAGGGSDKKAAAKAEAEAKRAAEAEEITAMVAAARATPKGDKKDIHAAMPKAYHPQVVEAAWYEWWEECGFFKPDVNSDKPPFVIVIPPPNVTGALHIGHALTNAIQDTIVRWKRMSGYNTLWVPGTDHAGIATQTVVEKKLAREQKLTRHDLGRENFVKEVWKYVDEYGGKICHQLRRIGSSVDWSRQAFTLDDNLSAAVLEAFVRMHESGVIYRDNRLVNWSVKLRTAVSDIEVDYIDIPKRTFLDVPGYERQVEFGVITSFAYPLEGGDGEIVVATTRPETMLGDTAVAVHPEDPRYLHLHGRRVVHPVSGRSIPIITDAELVDMSFGTGAVKITPAHDPNDFATGKRHKLEFISILDDNGCINDAGGPLFKGQPRFQTRVEIVNFLKEKGLFRGVADNPMRLGLCSRSKDVIEPVCKPQWWVACKGMAEKSTQAVRDGTLEIVPKEFESVWFRWLDNIRDWCISRQLWWGHRIPAYYVQLEGESSADRGSPGAPNENMTRWVVGRTHAHALSIAQARYPGKQVTLLQDEDVLDTWFSSGLFPFSVFQWPQQTADLAKFYPGALLETGHDILFFWVARMVMMGIQLTGQVPFKTVYLHAMVRDAHGRKMSKSLGNVIDPLNVISGISLQGLHDTLEGGNLDPKEVAKAKSGQVADFPLGIEECGTDALRFALVSYTTQARDINLDIARVISYRHWCNKLWNAIRFAMMNLPEGYVAPSPEELAARVPSMPPASRWLLSKLSSATAATIQGLDTYDFSASTQRCYSFWQYELCDAATRDALWAALDAGLRLLHPFMPFVTEELWQRLPKSSAQASTRTIMLAPYPAPVASWEDAQLEAAYDGALAVVSKVRSLRSDYGLLKQRPALYITCSDPAKREMLQLLAGDIATLSYSSDVHVLSGSGGPTEGTVPAGCGVSILDAVTTLHMALVGILDPALEVQKLEKKAKEVEGRMEALKARMAVPSYGKTPEAVRDEEAAKMVKFETELAVANAAIAEMRCTMVQ